MHFAAAQLCDLGLALMRTNVELQKTMQAKTLQEKEGKNIGRSETLETNSTSRVKRKMLTQKSVKAQEKKQPECSNSAETRVISDLFKEHWRKIFPT